ncbi:trypsin-like serine peptidase [Streptomyces sp. NPDC059534]|uniref:trypsin-like serine peptidase n=1 Tax=Streptomyces sp. NPDC059534 TaxID=3346859 RepID=UPI0036884F15
MHPQRLVWVRTGEPSGSGSGYLVGPRLVLTALHVVSHDGGPVGRILVRVGHPRFGAGLVERSAQICWPDPVPQSGATALDVALLWLDEPVQSKDGPVRWGKPAGVTPIPFEGAGFPDFAADNGGIAQFEYLRGDLPVVSTASSGWVLDCPVWPAAAKGADRPWAGASGAAIFCHGRVVGVAVEDNRTMGWRRLHAAPVHEALNSPGFKELVVRHGHSGTTADTAEVTADPPPSLPGPPSPPSPKKRLPGTETPGGDRPPAPRPRTTSAQDVRARVESEPGKILTHRPAIAANVERKVRGRLNMVGDEPVLALSRQKGLLSSSVSTNLIAFTATTLYARDRGAILSCPYESLRAVTLEIDKERDTDPRGGAGVGWDWYVCLTFAGTRVRHGPWGEQRAHALRDFLASLAG